MKLSRIIKRRKYKSSHRKMDLFSGDTPIEQPSGLPPKLERTAHAESQTVRDLLDSIRQSQET